MPNERIISVQYTTIVILFSFKTSLTTKLAVVDVNNANEHCKTFIKSFMTFDSEFSPIPTSGDNFVLLFVAKRDKNYNACTDSSSYVMSKRISQSCMNQL